MVCIRFLEVVLHRLGTEVEGFAPPGPVKDRQFEVYVLFIPLFYGFLEFHAGEKVVM